MNIESTKDVNERTIWRRGMYMVLFAIVLSIAKVVTMAVMIFQFLSVLFTGETNVQLQALGKSLSAYHYQIIMFLTFNGEELPYPFSEWPKALPL